MQQAGLSQQTGGPVLGLCWQPETPVLLIAHSDNNIKKWDLATNTITNIGSHNEAVKDIYCFIANNTSIIVSGGWDSRVKFWTWNNTGTLQLIGETYLAKPIHYMSGEYPLLVTAHSELIIHYWNLENIF
jgi:WD40 repeat protein